MRIAIVMNEFGEIAIDGRIVEGKNVAMAELAGGCVCCSLSGEFGQAVAELLAKAKPEWIVVETTGAAEPSALVHDIRENVPGVMLDSVVTVVDADAMSRFRNLGETGREQIEIADMLIVNKADLVPPETLAELKGALRGLNNRARMVDAVRCEVDVSALFGIGRSAPAPAHKPHETGLGHFVFVSERVLDYDAFVRLIETLPGGIYRAKGFVVTHRGGCLLNYVAGRFDLSPHECGKTELVFIGEGTGGAERGVREALESAFRAAKPPG
jgi:G3E family GTPase